jgi:hypothetical protein
MSERDPASTRPPPPLSRRDRWIGYALLSGLAAVLAVGFAVIVSPPLIDDLRGYLPLLVTIGFASTAGGFWYLWWRPR